jgi:hypothetical protein
MSMEATSSTTKLQSLLIVEHQHRKFFQRLLLIFGLCLLEHCLTIDTVKITKIEIAMINTLHLAARKNLIQMVIVIIKKN